MCWQQLDKYHIIMYGDQIKESKNERGKKHIWNR